MTPCQDDRSRYFSLDGVLVLLLHLYPVLALAVREWVAAGEYAAVFIALLMLVRDARRTESLPPYPRVIWWFVGMFAGLPLAVLIGQLFRLEWIPRTFDSPIRFLIVINCGNIR